MTIRVLSLGAGVQSTTVALMSAAGELPLLHHAVFADTGWEPAAVYRHLDWLQPVMEAAGITVHRVSRGNIRDNLVGVEDGRKRTILAPVYIRRPDDTLGLVRRVCTDRLKVEPIEAKLAEIIGKPPRARWPKEPVVELWFGISLDEIQRMRESQRRAVVYRYPLIEQHMTRGDCLEWLKRRGYPEPPRSSCIGCPYHSDHEWRRLTGEEFADAVEVERQMQANPRPGLQGVPYLHRSCRPLDQVDFSTAEDRGQMTLFGVSAGDCSGMCGT